MSKGTVLTALIIWMFISLILVFSVIGLLLFVRADNNTQYWQGENGRSTWATIGIGLYRKLIS